MYLINYVYCIVVFCLLMLLVSFDIEFGFCYGIVNWRFFKNYIYIILN